MRARLLDSLSASFLGHKCSLVSLAVIGTKRYVPGVLKNNDLEQRVRQALEELGKDAEVIKVSDINEITAYRVMFTPALAVDGEVKISGKLPSVEQLKEILA